MTSKPILPPLRPRGFILPVAAVFLGVLWFFVTGAASVPRDVPLNWDMAGHLLAGQEFRAALRAGDLPQVAALCRVWSVYPPLWHLLLGAWMAVFGSGGAAMAAYLASFLAVALVGTWLGLTAGRPAGASWGFAATACLLPASAQFGGLLHAYMLDAPAVALALLALGLLARWYEQPSRGAAAAAGAAMLATIMTKYNVGLPLLAAAGALGVKALVARDGRRVRAVVLVGAVVLVLWALFLTWKIAGWRTFQEFSRNRANTLDWSPVTRALAYVRLYARQNFGGPAIPAGIAVLALVGVRRRRHPFWLATAVYAATVFAAISRHPYFLDRLVLPVTAVMAVLAGFGVMTMAAFAGSRRPGAARVVGGAAVLAAAALLLHRGPLETGLKDQFPARNATLAAVSRHVEGILSEGRGIRSIRVVGTFNNFSENWVRLLWRRTGARGVLDLEYPYPKERERTGLDAGPDHRYGDILRDRLAAGPPDLVVALVPDRSSPWRDEDYQRWNAWKLNYVEALRAAPSLVLRDARHFSAARLTVLTFAADPRPVRYGAGWGVEENWGRWAVARQAELAVPCGPTPGVLVIRAATAGGQTGPQTCRVFAGDRALGSFKTEGAPWQWRDHRLDLPACAGDTLRLRLEFADRWPAGAADPRLLAMPVQSIHLEPVTD